MGGSRRFITQYILPLDATLLIIDGSWDQKKQVGTALVLYEPGGAFLSAKHFVGDAVDAFTAEAMALLNALFYIQNTIFNFTQYYIFTDSKDLEYMVNTNDVQASPSWHASSIIQRCLAVIQQLKVIRVVFAKCEHLQQAHMLANRGRKTKRIDFDGRWEHFLVSDAYKWRPVA